jgi:tetratricopeptide (TPR) repeat protein
MQSGRDVVFLFDRPEIGDPQVGDPMKVLGKQMPADSSYNSAVTIPFTTKVYVYDSMDKEDKVYGFTGSRKIITDVFSNGKTDKSVLKKKVWNDIGKAAEMAGSAAANSFLSTWKQDEFLVIYYDGAERAWNKGAEYAYDFKWKEAIEQWMTLLQSNGKEKKACAAYNIALGCFMCGQPDLALEWLDRSDSYEPVSLSKSLRIKIKQYTGKE